MAKCDLCNKTVHALDMTQLLNSYRTETVTDICPECEKWANKLKSDMLNEIAPRMRAAINERLGVEPKRSLFNQIFN